MKYLVTLTPTGRFFFGGDMTYTVGDVEKDKERVEDAEAKKRIAYNDAFASYIICSSKFPQQTSLLGMLRFLILSHDEDIFNGNTQKITNPVKAGELIGVHSFTVNSKHKPNNFGLIHSIGACFLCKDGACYRRAPLDYDLTVENYEIISGAKLNKLSLRIPIIKKGENEYTSKDELCAKYIAGSGDALDENQIYEEDIRIGIRRNENGKTEDNAFYKQIGYRLKDGFQFAFTVDTDEDLKAYGKQMVSVGADSSIFIFEAFEEVKEPELPTSYVMKGSGWQKIVLLSDTYIENEDIKEYVCYAITAVKPFRFIKSTVEDNTYDIVHNLHKRSERYNLYVAGSVFFVDEKDAEAFRGCVTNKNEFVQIGYNNCK